MDELDTLYDSCEVLMQELNEYNDKMRKSSGKHTMSDIETIGVLTKAIYHTKATIAMLEGRERYSYEYSGNDYNSRERNSSRADMNGNSYARGRTGNVRRDSIGRYSGDGDGDMMSILEDHARKTDNPMKRREIESFMERIRNM